MFRLFTLTLLWITSNAQSAVISTCPSSSIYDCGTTFGASFPDDTGEICCKSDRYPYTLQKYANRCYYECNNPSASGQSFEYNCGECCNPNHGSCSAGGCEAVPDMQDTTGYCQYQAGDECSQHMSCDSSVATACDYKNPDDKALKCLEEFPNSLCYFCQLAAVVTTTKPDPTSTAKPDPDPTTTAKVDPDPTSTSPPDPCNPRCLSAGGECFDDSGNVKGKCVKNSGGCFICDFDTATTSRPDPDPTTTAKVDPDPTTTSKVDPDPTTTSKACECLNINGACEKVRSDGSKVAGTCEAYSGSNTCGWCKPDTSGGGGCPTDDPCSQMTAPKDEDCTKNDNYGNSFTGKCILIDPSSNCYKCEASDTNPDTTKAVDTTSAPDPCEPFYRNNPRCHLKTKGESCGSGTSSYGTCKPNNNGCLECDSDNPVDTTTSAPDKSTTSAPDLCADVENARCLIDGAKVCYDESGTAGECGEDSNKCKICVFDDTATTSKPDDKTTTAKDDGTTSKPDDKTTSATDDKTTTAPDPCNNISGVGCKTTTTTDEKKTTAATDDKTTTSVPDATLVTDGNDATDATDAPNDDQSTEAPDDGTTSGPDTTDEPGCDAQKYPFARAKRGDCDDKPPMSCTLVIGLSADVCNINGLFTYYSLAMQLRLTIREIVYELKTDGVANECDLSKIHPYDFSISPIINNVDEDSADLRGSFVPLTADECPDLDEYCGEDGLKPNYEVSLNLGLRCGSCSELKDIRDALALMVVDGTIDGEFETKCERISAEQDSLCGQGLRDVTLLENPTATLYGEDGSVIEETEFDISRSDAPHHVYWFSIFAVSSLFSLFF